MTSPPPQTTVELEIPSSQKMAVVESLLPSPMQSQPPVPVSVQPRQSHQVSIAVPPELPVHPPAMGSPPSQTTLEVEPQTSPPLRYNPPLPVSFQSLPPAVVSASPSPRQTDKVFIPPELPDHPPVSVVVLPSPGEYFRRFRRFLGMEVVRAIIGLGVGSLMTYFWMKKKN